MKESSPSNKSQPPSGGWDKNPSPDTDQDAHLGLKTKPYYLRYSANNWEEIESQLIVEQAVNLTVNGEPWMTFMATPNRVDALAAGFLFNEGIVSSKDEIALLRPCDNNSNVDVWLTRQVSRPYSWQRTSGCTGGVTSVSLPEELAPLPVSFQISPRDVTLGMEQLFHVEGLYQEYRGLHCSGISDGRALVYHAADIGRHNTIDKLAGMALLEPAELPQRMIFTTGRISSEMLQKSARMRAEVVISRTSPTTMSVLLAEKLGITLIGYARKESFIVYAHPVRLAK